MNDDELLVDDNVLEDIEEQQVKDDDNEQNEFLSDEETIGEVESTSEENKIFGSEKVEDSMTPSSMKLPVIDALNNNVQFKSTHSTKHHSIKLGYSFDEGTVVTDEE